MLERLGKHCGLWEGLTSEKAHGGLSPVRRTPCQSREEYKECSPTLEEEVGGTDQTTPSPAPWLGPGWGWGSLHPPPSTGCSPFPTEIGALRGEGSCWSSNAGRCGALGAGMLILLNYNETSICIHIFVFMHRHMYLYRHIYT